MRKLGLASLALVVSTHFARADDCAKAVEQSDILIGSLQTAADQLSKQPDNTLDNYGMKVDGVLMTFRDVLELQRDNIAKYRDQRAQLIAECQKKPTTDSGQSVPQLIVDGAVAWFTDGLSLFAPGKSLHVDAGELLNGYPLGGPNAFVPSLRDHVLDALGVGGANNDLAKVLRDPVHASFAPFVALAHVPAFHIDTSRGLCGGHNSFFHKNLGLHC